jgi:hypothetical protein
MKVTLFVILLFFSFSLFSQTVAPDSAQYHVGALTTVCGVVVGVFTTKKGLTFLNFDKAYPINPFTAVIFPADSMNFEKPDFYKGKRICVTGRVKNYQGKTEIILKKANQIRFPD